MDGYWSSVLRMGWASYRARLGSGRRKLMQFLIQTAVLFAILYFVPWLGALQDEARLAAAGAGAVILGGILLLVFDVVCAPKKMNEMARERVRELRRALRLEDEAQKIKQEMLELCKDGRIMLARSASIEKFELWKERALVALRLHYDVNFVYELEHESFFLRPPKTDAERAEGLVSYLEQTSLSWRSKAETAQSSFAPRNRILPWLEESAIDGE